ncbi:MAG TPA: nucleoside deaminase, partial [Noviherbaspirillum sp.]
MSLSNASFTETDRRLMRVALAVAERAKAAGRHPFGAIVADEHGNIVAEAGNNSMPPQGDPTQHAERVAAALAAQKLSPDAL